MAPYCPALLRHRESHEEAIYAIAFNQIDASLADVFATVGANRVTVYRLAEEEEEHDELKPATSLDAKGADKRPRDFSRRTLHTLQAYRDEDDDESFYCVAWGLEAGEADGGTAGSLLAVGGAQRHIKLLDCCAGGIRAVLQGHGGAINEVRFHPIERALLLSASADESIRLWHVGTGACLASFVGDQGHRDAVISIDFQHTGAAFASGSIDGTVKVWSLEDQKLRARVAQAAAEYSQYRAEEEDKRARKRQRAEEEEEAAAAASVVEEAAAAASVEEEAAAAASVEEEAAAAASVEVAKEEQCQGRSSADGRIVEESGGGTAAGASEVTSSSRSSASTTANTPPANTPPASTPPANTPQSTGPMAMVSATKLAPSRHQTLVCQFPLATYERVHFDPGAELSYWVDCVRYVGRLLLTRGSNGMALLWDPKEAVPASASEGDGDGKAGNGERATSGGSDGDGDGTMEGAGGSPSAVGWATYGLGESRPRLVPTSSLAFRIGGTAGIWYLRFALDPLHRRLAMGNTRGEVCVWDLERAQLAPMPPRSAAGDGGGTAAPAATTAQPPLPPPTKEKESSVGRVAPAFAALRVTLDEGGGSKKPKKGGSKKSVQIAEEDLLTVRTTAMSHDGLYVVGGCDDGSIVVWQLAT